MLPPARPDHRPVPDVDAATCRQIDPLTHRARGESDKSSDTAAASRYRDGMDMLPLGPVELVAVDAARNVRRRWSVTAAVDLFGHVMVETCWGRIGGPGRCLVRSFASEADALRHLRALVARRRSAPRRIGTAYVDGSTGRPLDPVRRPGDRPAGAR